MGWKKVKLGEILVRRRDPIKVLPNVDYKLVTIKLNHKGVTLRSVVKGINIKSSMSKIRAGDFILSGIDARNGAFGIVPDYLDQAIVTNDFWCLDPDENKLDKNFLLFLTTTNFFDNICKQSSDGTTQRIRLQKDKFFNYELFLPSIDEQIILTDKFKRLEIVNLALKNELINQLSLVKQLRQSFLSEAMHGKLCQFELVVDQETGHQLLEKIIVEKAQLIKDKKLKKEKELPPIKSEEIPFEIPKNWVWCRFGEVIYTTESGKSPNCLNQPVEGNKWGVIKTTAVQEMIFLENENKILPNGFVIQNQHKITEGDVLITRAGPKNRVGVVCCVENLNKNLILSDKTIRILHSKFLLNSKFIALTLNSEPIKKIIETKMTGMADSQVNISQDNIKGISFPLPPLFIQNQIVKKLGELMKICDNLENSIKQSQLQNEQLLQQVLKEALEVKENVSN